jgi:diguanylate cyclase (GGDEF)-like protein
MTATPTLPADTQPPLLRLPLIEGPSWQVRLLGLAAGGALIWAIASLQPRLYPELPIAVLYLVPVVLAAWVGGTVPGIAAALAAASARLLADQAAAVVPSHPTVPYWNFAIHATLYLGLAVLLARLHRTLLYERGLALTDVLTGLGNRRFLERVAGIELNRSRRYGRPFALAYIDVDGFKAVNDRHGHDVGDRLLRLIAHVLADSLRASDVVARLGGDEFAIVLPETAASGAQVAMEKAHERLTAAAAAAGFDVSFSIGVVACRDAPHSTRALLEAADRVMYTVKHGPKGEVRCEEHGALLPV